MDRVDLKVTMSPAMGKLMDASGEPSEMVRTRVHTARNAALSRWAHFGWSTNAEVPGSALRGRFRPGRAVIANLETAMRNGTITARGADRTLRVAWSISDLRGGSGLEADDVNAALMFRERRAA